MVSWWVVVIAFLLGVIMYHFGRYRPLRKRYERFEDACDAYGVDDKGKQVIIEEAVMRITDDAYA